MTRLYRIICLKRSQFRESNDFQYTSDWYNASKIVYWREDRAVYTEDIDEAGIYSIKDIDLCAGDWLDWMLEPTWR